MTRKLVLLGFAAAAALVIAVYMAKYSARDDERELSKLERQIEAALREQELLRGELSHLSRQEWIEAYARENLGMGPARAEQFSRGFDLDHRFDAAPRGERPEGGAR